MKNYIMKDFYTDEKIGEVKNDCLYVTDVGYRGVFPLTTATDEYGDTVTGYIWGNDECYDRFQNGEDYFFQYMFDPENSKYYRCCYNIPDEYIPLDDIDWESPVCILEEKDSWYYMEEVE